MGFPLWRRAMGPATTCLALLGAGLLLPPAASASGSGSLPLGQTWCAADTDKPAEPAPTRLAEGIFQVPGQLGSADGMYTLEYDRGKLASIAFRSLDDTDGANHQSILEALRAAWGEGAGDGVSWQGVDDTTIEIRRTSGDVRVAWQTTPGRCRDELAPLPVREERPPEGDIYDVDPFADDPLQADDQARREAAEREQEQEEPQVEEAPPADEDVEIDW